MSTSTDRKSLSLRSEKETLGGLLANSFSLPTTILRKDQAVSSFIPGHRATCTSQLIHQKKQLIRNNAAVIQRGRFCKPHKCVSESYDRGQWVQFEKDASLKSFQSLRAQEDCISTHVMKWNTNKKERNSSHFKGDKSSFSTLGYVANIAELCSTEVAGNGFKAAEALSDGLMMVKCMFLRTWEHRLLSMRT